VASVSTPILGKARRPVRKERLLVISLALFLVGSIGAAALEHLGADRLAGGQGAGAAVFP